MGTMHAGTERLFGWAIACAALIPGLAGCTVAAGERAHMLVPAPSEGMANADAVARAGAVVAAPRQVFPTRAIAPAAAAFAPAAARFERRASAPTACETPVPFTECLGSPPDDPGDWYLGVGGSLLPNVGVSIHAGYVFSTSLEAIWSVEAEGTWQFIDDKSFVDDGNPEAGDWYQVRVGVKAALPAGVRRRTTWRAGAVWVRAEGVPNIIQNPGDYFGAYIGVGFEADISSSTTIGPELSLLAVTDGDDFSHGFVPQFSWKVSFWPCGRPQACAGSIECGELYGGLVAFAGPGLGGGIEWGQRFSRSATCESSFELCAGVQELADGTLFGEGSGDAAQVRGGLKWLHDPSANRHWALRAGAAWMRTTAETAVFDEPGDYFGIYGSVGYELDLGDRLRTGPELALYAMTQEGEFEPQFVPQLVWRVLFLL